VRFQARVVAESVITIPCPEPRDGEVRERGDAACSAQYFHCHVCDVRCGSGASPLAVHNLFIAMCVM